MSPAGVLTAPRATPAPPESHPDSESLFELYYGVRVEKPMSTVASVLASRLLARLSRFAVDQGLAEVVAETLFELDSAAGLQRRPDVAVVCTQPGRELGIDESAAWPIAPDLAVEVVSPSNLAEEIDEKIDEYFAAGVRRVWILYPRSRKLHDYSSPSASARISEDRVVDGGDILPGFQMSVRELFLGLKPLPEDATADE